MVKVGAFIIISAEKLQSLEAEHEQVKQKYEKLYALYIGILNRPLRREYLG